METRISGRPKGKKNPSSPAGRLERALENGADLRDLKVLALSLVKDPDTKMSPAQVERIVKTLFDVELKLLELDYKYNNNSESGAEKDDETEEDEVVFKLTSD